MSTELTGSSEAVEWALQFPDRVEARVWPGGKFPLTGQRVQIVKIADKTLPIPIEFLGQAMVMMPRATKIRATEDGIYLGKGKFPGGSLDLRDDTPIKVLADLEIISIENVAERDLGIIKIFQDFVEFPLGGVIQVNLPDKQSAEERVEEEPTKEEIEKAYQEVFNKLGQPAYDTEAEEIKREISELAAYSSDGRFRLLPE